MYHSDYADIQKEADKYRILPPASDDDDEGQCEEEEIQGNETIESDYPPLRLTSDDDISQTRTFERGTGKERLLPE